MAAGTSEVDYSLPKMSVTTDAPQSSGLTSAIINVSARDLNVQDERGQEEDCTCLYRLQIFKLPCKQKSHTRILCFTVHNVIWPYNQITYQFFSTTYVYCFHVLLHSSVSFSKLINNNGHLTNNAWNYFECSHIPLRDKSMESWLLLNDIKLDFDPLLQALCGLLLQSQYRLQLVIECCYFGTSFSGPDWAVTRLS